MDGRVNADGTLTSYLSDVSYGSNFSYTFNTDNEGDQLYIYASVASNFYSWGAVSPKYQSGINGTKKLQLSNVHQLTNNGKVYDSKKTADIEETIVTEEDLDKIPSASTSNPWFAVLDLAMRNFKRHWIGKITLEKGANNIRIDFNQEKINKLLEDHYYNKENNGRKIYNIYIFLIWYKVYFVDNITSREEL